MAPRGWYHVVWAVPSGVGSDPLSSTSSLNLLYSHTINILPQSHTWTCDQDNLHCRFTCSLTEHTHRRQTPLVYVTLTYSTSRLFTRLQQATVHTSHWQQWQPVTDGTICNWKTWSDSGLNAMKNVYLFQSFFTSCLRISQLCLIFGVL